MMLYFKHIQEGDDRSWNSFFPLEKCRNVVNDHVGGQNVGGKEIKKILLIFTGER